MILTVMLGRLLECGWFSFKDNIMKVVSGVRREMVSVDVMLNVIENGRNWLVLRRR